MGTKYILLIYWFMNVFYTYFLFLLLFIIWLSVSCKKYIAVEKYKYIDVTI